MPYFPHTHFIICTSLHLINWLQRFYRITMSLKRPFVPKSDVKQLLTTTTTTLNFFVPKRVTSTLVMIYCFRWHHLRNYIYCIFQINGTWCVIYSWIMCQISRTNSTFGIKASFQIPLFQGSYLFSRGTGMIASSSTFRPHPGRVIRDLFRLLDAVTALYGSTSLQQSSKGSCSLLVSGYNLRADCQWRTLVPPLNSGANAAPASVLALM